jgi:predicted metalloprotease
MGGPMPKLGIGGFLVLLVLSFIFKKDFFALLGGAGGPSSGTTTQSAPVSPDEKNLEDFVSFVLDDNQGTWEKIFASQGQTYRHAKLVLFNDSVSSGCGYAETAMGPFYCPADEKVYIDLGFYRELKERFGAPGDFAQAYVIAHELGHHVQNQLGVSGKVERLQQQDPRRANELSVRLELQADCLAGVWAHSTSQRDLLQAGDVEEAMTAASAVGDDRIQKQATGTVNPETWTHGSAAQRTQWFNTGLESGDLKSCDTFAAR